MDDVAVLPVAHPDDFLPCGFVNLHRLLKYRVFPVGQGQPAEGAVRTDFEIRHAQGISDKGPRLSLHDCRRAVPFPGDFLQGRVDSGQGDVGAEDPPQFPAAFPDRSGGGDGKVRHDEVSVDGGKNGFSKVFGSPVPVPGPRVEGSGLHSELTGGEMFPQGEIPRSTSGGPVVPHDLDSAGAVSAGAVILAVL